MCTLCAHWGLLNSHKILIRNKHKIMGQMPANGELSVSWAMLEKASTHINPFYSLLHDVVERYESAAYDTFGVVGASLQLPCELHHHQVQGM
jgi:hypothetical protein